MFFISSRMTLNGCSVHLHCINTKAGSLYCSTRSKKLYRSNQSDFLSSPGQLQRVCIQIWKTKCGWRAVRKHVSLQLQIYPSHLHLHHQHPHLVFIPLSSFSSQRLWCCKHCRMHSHSHTPAAVHITCTRRYNSSVQPDDDLPPLFNKLDQIKTPFHGFTLLIFYTFMLFLYADRLVCLAALCVDILTFLWVIMRSFHKISQKTPHYFTSSIKSESVKWNNITSAGV